jgi:hypothetical protein
MPRESVPEQHINLLEALIRTLAHPCLVLDENHDLVEVIGDVSAYCRIPEGRLTAAAGAFLRSELQPEARTLFLLVRADRKPASSGLLHLPDRQLALRLEAAPLQVGERALTVLSFIEQRDGPVEAVAGLASTDRSPPLPARSSASSASCSRARTPCAGRWPIWSRPTKSSKPPPKNCRPRPKSCSHPTKNWRPRTRNCRPPTRSWEP